MPLQTSIVRGLRLLGKKKQGFLLCFLEGAMREGTICKGEIKGQPGLLYLVGESNVEEKETNGRNRKGRKNF